MAETADPISQTLLIPPGCHERFLSLDGPDGAPLRNAGVLTAGVSRLFPPFQVGRPAPNFHAVLLTLSGRASCRTPQGEGGIQAGTVWVGPAGRPYAYQAEDEWHVCWFHVRPAGLAVGPDIWSADSHIGPALLAAMEGYLAETLHPEGAGLTAAPAYAEVLGVLLRRIFAQAGGGRSIPPHLISLWGRVEQDPAADWTVERLAEAIHVSAPHLYRLTDWYYGDSPMTIVSRLRLRQAEAMLRGTDYTLERIADRVGYGTAFSLSRAFKRQYGVSPQTFRGQSRAPSTDEIGYNAG